MLDSPVARPRQLWARATTGPREYRRPLLRRVIRVTSRARAGSYHKPTVADARVFVAACAAPSGPGGVTTGAELEVHSMPQTCRLAFCLLAALLAAPVHAAPPPDDDEEEADETRWGLDLKTEVDQDSGRSFYGKGAYSLTPDTRVSLDATSVNAGTNLAGLVSNGLSLGLTHDFDPWSVDLGVGRWQDNGLVTAKELTGGVDFNHDAWTVGLIGEARRSDFDAFNANASVTLPNGTVLAVKARPTCSLDNAGFGLHGDYAGEVWGFSAIYTGYRYADTRCKFDSAGLAALERARKAQFLQLAADLANRLERKVTTRIGSQNALLESSYGAGASWRHDDLVLALDYTRQKDFFAGLAADTLALTATADFGHGTGVDVTLGATRSPSLPAIAAVTGAPGTSAGGTVAYLGLALRAKF
jgi:hypothetical protein